MRWWRVLAACAFLHVAVPLPASAQPACAIPLPATSHDIALQADVGDRLRKVHSLADGHGVKVAVIDTGVEPVPRLGQIIDGGDLLAEGSTALADCDAHGTVVAGIIRAVDTGDGVVGVAPGTQLIAVRQTSSRNQRPEEELGGTLASLAEAIHRSIDLGAQVINVSVVSCLPPAVAPDLAPLDTALARAEDSGVVVVAAAGNESPRCPRGSTVLPAARPSVVAVAAHDSPDSLSSYSLDAPGALSAAGLVEAGVTGAGLSAGLESGGGVAGFEGTSFAAPVVSGVVALLRQRHPEASPAQLREMLSASVDPTTGAVAPERIVGMLAPTDGNKRGLTVARAQVEGALVGERLGYGLAIAAGVAVLALAARGARR